MPCNCDHMEPNRHEKESQKVAKFLVHVYECEGRVIPQEIFDAAGDIYGNIKKVHEWTNQLCAILKGLPEEDKEKIIYNARSKESRQLADWWKAHQEADSRKKESLTKERERLLEKIEKIDKELEEFN